jgi:RNA:NAD 2'-phosphotransferase (TPT1/KptA family)
MAAPVYRCAQHGYHGGDPCPTCGERSRQVLSGDRRERLSRFVSGALIGSCVTIFGSVLDIGGDGSQSETVLMTQR